MSCVRLSEVGAEEKKLMHKVIRSVIAVWYLHQGAEITGCSFVLLGLRISGLIWFLFSENCGGVPRRSRLSGQIILLWEFCEDPNLILLICSLFTKHWYFSGFRFRLSAVRMVVSGFLPQSEHTDSVGWEAFAVWEQLKSNCAMFALEKANNVASSGLDDQRRQTFGRLCSLMS